MQRARIVLPNNPGARPAPLAHSVAGLFSAGSLGASIEIANRPCALASQAHLRPIRHDGHFAPPAARAHEPAHVRDVREHDSRFEAQFIEAELVIVKAVGAPHAEPCDAEQANVGDLTKGPSNRVGMAQNNAPYRLNLSLTGARTLPVVFSPWRASAEPNRVYYRSLVGGV